MKTNYTVAENGYAVINGELTPVKFSSIIAKGDKIYYEIPGLGTFENIVTYASPESFERGDVVTRVRTKSNANIVDGKLGLYSMENGEPVLSYHDVDVNLTRRYEPIIPEGFYESREECLKNNTYIEVTEDGQRIEHVGILKKVALDPDQKEFIRDLEGMFRKAKEMGIFFTYSTEDYVMGVANLRNLRKKSLEYNCEGEGPESDAECVWATILPHVKIPSEVFDLEFYGARLTEK